MDRDRRDGPDAQTEKEGLLDRRRRRAELLARRERAARQRRERGVRVRPPTSLPLLASASWRTHLR